MKEALVQNNTNSFVVWQKKKQKKKEPGWIICQIVLDKVSLLPAFIHLPPTNHQKFFFPTLCSVNVEKFTH